MSYEGGEEPRQFDRVRHWAFGRHEYGTIQNKKYPHDSATVLWDGHKVGSSMDWHNLELVSRGSGDER